jgi:hypothetical protein
MNNYKILLLTTTVTAVVILAIGPNNIQKAMAQSPNTINATPETNTSLTITLKPVFTENDKSTPPKAVVINCTHGLQVTYSGTGVVKGVNFSAIGTVLLIPRSDGAVDFSGHAVITASNGEKGNYTFYSIGRTGADGTTRDNGAAFFHANPSGKLGIVNNLVVVFKDKIDNAGNGTTIEWEWK